MSNSSFVEITKNLFDFIESQSVDTEKYSVEFSGLPINSNVENSTEDTAYAPVSVIVKITNKQTGEVVKSTQRLFNLPVETQMGFKINGTLYNMMSVDRRASGWYIIDKKEGGKINKIMEFVPTRGTRLTFIERYGEIQVILGSPKSTAVRKPRKINLGVFLKAITGKNYEELIIMLGSHNRIISNSFKGDEPNRDECIREVIKSLLSFDSALDVDDAFREISRRLYNPAFMDAKNSLPRTRRNSSFTSRAQNTILAKDVLNYKKGSVLSKDMLEDIDSHSEIDTLFVKTYKQTYELKKYIIPDTPLMEEELFTQINMFACSLLDFPLVDLRYELYNRSTDTFKDTVFRFIASRLNSIVLEVSRALLISNTLVDLDLPKFDQWELIDFLKNSIKDSQTAETTNFASVISKTAKVVSEYNGRGSDDLVRVKDSELGIYDPYQMPESSQVGFIHYLTLTAEKEEDGDSSFKGSYIKVVNGKTEGGKILLSPHEIVTSYIAPWDANLEENMVPAYFDGSIVTVPRERIQYQEYSCFNNLSYPTANIPLLNFSDGKRIVMGGNQDRQALETIKTERPLVATGTSSIFNLGVIRAKDILNKYYLDNQQNILIDYEEFVNIPIKLLKTSLNRPGYRQIDFKFVYSSEHDKIFRLSDDDTAVINYSIPCYTKTTSNSITEYRIKYKDIYTSNDIVAYSSTFDINKYNLDVYADLGHMKVPEGTFEYEKATGNNYLVALKSWGSSTIDDSMVMSSNVLGTYKTAHINSYEIKCELKEDLKDESVEYFGYKGKAYPGILESGVPKVGTVLSPRDVVIAKYRKKGDIVKDTSIRLDAVTEGVVVSAFIKDNKAKVMIASISEIETGDKMTGDHGNKGTIGKIIPKSQMPYLEDGRTVDIIINPLGLPSRRNLSQLLTAIIGYAMLKRDPSGKSGVVITPQCKNVLDIVKSYEKDARPEVLYDGRTGLPFDRKGTVGVWYFKKLSHTSTSKSNSAGMISSINPTTLQPKKGKRVGGGQTLGEMEFWALESANAKNLIEEFQSIQSDDIDSRSNVIEYLETKDKYLLKGKDLLKGKKNNNASASIVPIRALGANIINTEDGNYKPVVMTNSDICALAEEPLNINSPNCLQNPKIFGLSSSPKQLAKNREKWGYMNLGVKIISPFWVYNGKYINLIVVTPIFLSDGSIKSDGDKPLTSAMSKDIIGGNKYLGFTGDTIYISESPEIIEADWLNGIEAIVKAFEVFNLKMSRRYYSNVLNSKRSSKRPVKPDDLFNITNMLRIIDNLESSNLELKDFVIENYPVLPKSFRMEIDGRSSDFDMYYKNIISSIQASKNTKDATSIFNKIAGFQGLDDRYALPKEKNCRNLLQYFVGKQQDNTHGYMRNSVQSKIQSRSYRSVVSPSPAGLIRPYEIGIPFKLVVNAMREELRPVVSEYLKRNSLITLYIDGVLNSLMNNDVNRFIENTNGDSNNFIELKEVVIDYIENNQTTIYGRQPTLHKLGIRGYYIKVIEGNNVVVHPLVCSGYNMDFDGDQGHGELPISVEARKEAIDKLSPMNDLYNPKDGSCVLTPTQDTILGCYLATMLPNNRLELTKDDLKDMKFYGSLESLKYDIYFRKTNYQSIVCYTDKNGNKYLSTAGRILLNSVIPSGLSENEFTNVLKIPGINKANYKELRYDCLVNKSVMKKITKDLCKEVKDGKTVCDILDDILVFGVTACDTSNISITLDDYIVHPELDKMTKKYNKIIEKIQFYYELGLITKESRNSTSSKIYSYLYNYIKDTLLDYYDRNNNLFIILDSGARGNLSQLMSTCGMVGTISKTNSEELSTPVLSNYIQGLSSYDQMLVSYGTRMGVSTVQNKTEDAGALTRSAVYTLSGFKIVEHDCGNENQLIKVRYSDKIKSIVLNRNPVDYADILDIELSSDDPNFNEMFSINRLGILDSNVMNYIKRNHIREIQTTKGKINIKYYITDLFKNLCFNRLAKDLPYLKPFGFNKLEGVMTEKTVDYIEDNNITEINMRTMLNCSSVGGVCAKCYGISYNRKLPSVGESIGVTAAQSIGESALQANMEVINAGGKSNGNVSAVNAFKSRIVGAVPNIGVRAIVAPVGGMVKIRDLGQNVILNISTDPKFSRKLNKNLLEVSDGEIVQQGQILTKGTLDLNDITRPTINETIRERQWNLLKIFYDIFGGSIAVRNFECVVRCQTSLVRVIKSSNPKFKEGMTYFKQELDGEEGIECYSKMENANTVIGKFGGFASTLAYQDFARNLADIVANPDRQTTNSNSFLGNITLGGNVITGKPGVIPNPNHKTIYTMEAKLKNDFDDFDFVKTSESIATTFNSLDMASVFSEFMPEETEEFVEEVDLGVNRKPENTDTDSYKSTEIQKSNLFN